MKAKINSAIESTNGYKTKAAAVVYLLITIFGAKVPFLVENQDIIVNSVNVLILSGLLHDAWRNRYKILDWMKSIVKKK